MKRTLSLILVGFMLTLTLPAQEKQPKRDGIWCVAFVIGCVVVAGYVIWRVHATTATPDTPVQLVLEKSMDHGTWTPVVTNTVILKGTNWVDVFSEKMTDPICFYRARIQR